MDKTVNYSYFRLLNYIQFKAIIFSGIAINLNKTGNVRITKH